MVVAGVMIVVVAIGGSGGCGGCGGCGGGDKMLMMYFNIDVIKA